MQASRTQVGEGGALRTPVPEQGNPEGPSSGARPPRSAQDPCPEPRHKKTSPAQDPGPGRHKGPGARPPRPAQHPGPEQDPAQDPTPQNPVLTGLAQDPGPEQGGSEERWGSGTRSPAQDPSPNPPGSRKGGAQDPGPEQGSAQPGPLRTRVLSQGLP